MSPEALQRFHNFLEDRKKDIGYTSTDAAHEKISDIAINLLNDKCPLAGKTVLDIGCGTGRDLKRFKKLGAEPIGLTLYPEKELIETNITYFTGDQSFSDLPDGVCDVIFARHVLEHSVAPFFTLTEYNRLLKPNGWAYVEVPAPDQYNQHELNHNHYSVLGEKMWAVLMARAGFGIAFRTIYPLDLLNEIPEVIKDGDKWLGFYLVKERNSVISKDEWVKLLK